jgi:hypothetical protein
MPKYTNNTGAVVSINGIVMGIGETRDFPYYFYREDVDIQAYDEASTVPVNTLPNSGLHELTAEEEVTISTFVDGATVEPYVNNLGNVEYYVGCDAGTIQFYFNGDVTDYAQLSAGLAEYGTIPAVDVGSITVVAVEDAIVRFYVRNV